MSDLLLADVSRHQGDVDWAAYSAWSQAAICKATGGDHDSGGSSWVDPKLGRNRLAMRRHLAVRGFYHFLQLDADPAEQARHFAATVGELLPGEFAVLDVEQDANHAAHETFCRVVDELLGGLCWLYGGKQVRTSRPVWVARYYDETPNPKGEPTIPHVLWQYTSKGHAPGIAGACDLNVHRGDITSLRRFVKGEGDSTMPVDDDLRRVLNEGTAKGQSTWAGTSKAVLAGIQTVANSVNAVAGQVKSAVEGIARLATDVRAVDAKAVQLRTEVADLHAKLDAAVSSSSLPDLTGVVSQAVKDGRLVNVSIQPYEQDKDGG